MGLGQLPAASTTLERMMSDPYLEMLGLMKDAGETQRWGFPVNFWRTIPLDHHKDNPQDALCLVEALSYSGPWQISLECLLTLHEACGADLVEAPLYDLASGAVKAAYTGPLEEWREELPEPLHFQDFLVQYLLDECGLPPYGTKRKLKRGQGVFLVFLEIGFPCGRLEGVDHLVDDLISRLDPALFDPVVLISLLIITNMGNWKVRCPQRAGFRVAMEQVLLRSFPPERVKDMLGSL